MSGNEGVSAPKLRAFANLDTHPREGKDSGVKEYPALKEVKSIGGLFKKIVGKATYEHITDKAGDVHRVNPKSMDKFLARNVSAETAFNAAFVRNASHQTMLSALEQQPQEQVIGGNTFNGSFASLFEGKTQEEVMHAIKFIPERYFNCVDRNGDTLLNRAVISGHTEVAKHLLERPGFDLDRQVPCSSPPPEKCTMLYNAVLKGNKEMVELLLFKGARASIPSGDDSRTPLYLALDSNKGDVAKLLLDKGGIVPKHVDSQGRTLLHAAVRFGNREIIEDLITRDVDINANGKALLEIGLAYKGRDMLQFLISKGAKVDSVDSNGRTLLHTVAERGDVEAVGLLLRERATLDYKDKDGMTPLQLALKAKKPEVVKLLLEKGASLMEADVAKYKNEPWFKDTGIKV